MGKRLIITEDEKRRILGLYEQEIPAMPETTPTDERKGELIKFLTDNSFEENQNYIGSYQIKTQDNSFGVVLTLTPDKTQVKTATVIGPDDVITQMEQIFNDKRIPFAKTEGKLITRAAFSDEELLKSIIAKVKDIDGGQY
jgi:hypothetical protein